MGILEAMLESTHHREREQTKDIEKEKKMNFQIFPILEWELLILKRSMREMSDLWVGRGEQKYSLRGRQQGKKLNNYLKDDGTLSEE